MDWVFIETLLNVDNYKFAKQIGATHIVAHLTNYFSGNNPEISSGGNDGWGVCDNEPIWDKELLGGLKKDLNENGLELEALENLNPLHWSDISIWTVQKKLHKLKALKNY